jgi:site-specific DNA recombinase
MTANRRRAAVYGRQSKDKTKSIDEQTAECEADATGQGWTIDKRYSDGVSASRFATKAREGWPRLLSDVDAERLDALVLWESSRGDRDAEAWLGLLRRCRDHRVLIRVTTHSRTYDMNNARDWRTLAEDGVDNAYESEKTSARLRRNTAAQAAAGRPHGRIRYGYERVYDERTRAMVGERPHHEQAPIVVEIVRRIGRSDPVTVVAADLERRRVQAPAGRNWTGRTIRSIATSPAYIGVRMHKGERHPAIWPPLVDEADHLAAVRVLSDPARKTTRPGRQKWLLSYLVRCGVGDCDRPMHRVPHQSGKPEQARYACSRGCTGIRASDLDEYVTRLVCRRLARVARERPRKTDDATVIQVRAEADRLRTRLNEWRDSGARGETSPASLARIEAQLAADIADADRRAVAATTPPTLAELLKGRPGYDALRRRFDALPVPARREVITLILDVRVRRAETLGRHGFDDERVLITWR